MEQRQIVFPEISEPVEARSNLVRFEPRQLRRRAPSRLSGDGLADRLRRDVARQVEHRRRMLAHLSSQARQA